MPCGPPDEKPAATVAAPATWSEGEQVARLERALDRGGLTLVYQPKLDLASGRLAGVEALARWQEPGAGAVPASLFVPLAERCGLIDRLTGWMIAAALDQSARWHGDGLPVRIAINLSALSLRDVALPDRIEHLCRDRGVPCESVTIEITESASQALVRLLDTLTRFRLKGFHVALDDFGTGYSSLLQLQQLPYSELKIDRCFVREIVASHESRLIVRAVVDLAHALGLTAVAEGVEDAQTLRLLREMGCDEAQGFLIAEPMDGTSLADWLAKTERLAAG